MLPFNDQFSKQSETYRKYRPGYPSELFAYLASLTPAHERAWDCGTGNGQAAVGLAEHYARVYATDPSPQQIAHAQANDKVAYRVEKAEEPGLKDHSVDLITVAQALHWFRFDRFYATVKRVLKTDGIIAVWAYGLPFITAEIDESVKKFHDLKVGAFWQPENRLIEQEYSTIPFPFEELAVPSFQISKRFTLGDLLGLLRSWSAVQRYVDAHGTDPVDEMEAELAHLWPNPYDEKEVTWKLILRVGRV